MLLLALLAWILGLPACATYDERLANTHRVYYDGRTELAVGQLQAALERALAEGTSDAGVLRLELAMACQAAGRYEEAVEHLKRADAELEVLDYTDDPIDSIASFAYAPEARDYRASPPERVMVNTQNMLNQLLAGNLRGAEVESRRLINLLVRSDLDLDELNANRFAWGLAGLVLLAARDPAPARDALTRARGSGLEQPRFLDEAHAGGPTGTLLVVAQAGRVPVRREAVYVFPTGTRTVRINLPSLVSRPPAFHTVRLELDGRDVGQLPVVFDLGSHARVRYDDELPRLLAAAVSQALPRVLASEALGAAAEAAAEGIGAGAEASAKQDGADETTAQAAGLLAELAVKLIGSLVASVADWLFAEVQGTDTRSWTLLPEHLLALRLDLPPGTYDARLILSGRAGTRRLDYEVEVSAGQLALVHAVTSIHGGDIPIRDTPAHELAATEIEEALRLLEATATLKAVLD